MFDGILRDAVESGTTLPEARVRAVLDRHGHVLDAVTSPVVMHNDLWPANIFLDDDLRIVGVIDTERTVWGDPLFDVVGANQMAEEGAEEQIVEGNTDAGGVLAAKLALPNGSIRLALYQLYYRLILATEIDIRGFEGDGCRSTGRRSLVCSTTLCAISRPTDRRAVYESLMRRSPRESTDEHGAWQVVRMSRTTSRHRPNSAAEGRPRRNGRDRWQESQFSVGAATRVRRSSQKRSVADTRSRR